MGVLADWQIEREQIVTPFVRLTPAEAAGKITWGVSHYGIDVRCSEEFFVFSPAHAAGGIIDPKNFNAKFLVNNPEQIKLDGCVIIPPNSFALTQTIERIKVPRSVMATVLGKSTYARCGIICNVTPLEPEWQGQITIELSNTAPLPAKIYPCEGIAQILFHRADGYTTVVLDDIVERLTEIYKAAAENGHTSKNPRVQAEEEVADLLRASTCRVSYADKKGRYQNQGANVVLPCAAGGSPKHADGSPGTKPDAS